MEQIGHSLVDEQGNELKFWGDTAGQIQGMPDAIRLPNGDDVHCPEVYIEYEGAKLVERWLAIGAEASTVYDGSKIIVTRPPPMPATVEQRLESVGLSLDDLKAALGIA